MKLSEWSLIGECAVDAGCVMLIDPCYTIDKTNDEWYSREIVDRCHENDGRHHGVKIDGHALEYSGVVVEAGFGDGCYPVYVRYSDEGSWGKRIAEVKIVFIGDEDDCNV